MNILSDGYLRDSITGNPLTNVIEEIYVPSDSDFMLNDIMKYIKNGVTIPVIRLYLLNEDEQIIADISSDFISGTLNCTYQTGQRRTLSVQLINKNNKYKPKPITGLIWINSKFRLDLGVVYNNKIYWKQQGIFVLKDPSYVYERANETINLSLCDKFGLFDGTVFGRTSLKTIVPVGVSMKQAFYTILTSEKGNGNVWDKKPITFDSNNIDTLTYYTIKQEAGENISENLIKMANTISCDIYYNEYGNMVVKSNVNNFINKNFPVVWRFDDGDRDLLSITRMENWSKMRNKIVVKGAIANGYQFNSTLENRNLASDFCIQYCGEAPEVIKDEKLYADFLCQERAIYEMVNYTRGVKSLNLSCTYNPFLDVNQSILIYNSQIGIYNENFVIDSFSMQMGNDFRTDITLTNINYFAF